MNTGLQAVGGFRIDRTLLHHATEGRLDMPAGTAEAVIKVEVPEGGIEIVPPKQMDDAPPEPDAFRITGRPRDLLGNVGQVVAARRILFRIGLGIGLGIGLLLLGLFGLVRIGLTESRTCRKRKRHREPEYRNQSGWHGSQGRTRHDGELLEEPFPLNGLRRIVSIRIRQQYGLQFGKEDFRLSPLLSSRRIAFK
jgi:hypothetical protein